MEGKAMDAVLWQFTNVHIVVGFGIFSQKKNGN
jgi:hypothetical protein